MSARAVWAGWRVPALDLVIADEATTGTATSQCPMRDNATFRYIEDRFVQLLTSADPVEARHLVAVRCRVRDDLVSPTTDEQVLLDQPAAHEILSLFFWTVEASHGELVLNRLHRFVLADPGRNADPLRKHLLYFPLYLFDQVLIV